MRASADAIGRAGSSEEDGCNEDKGRRGPQAVIRTVVWPVVSVVALAVAWLSAGRRVTLLLDKFITGGAMPLPADRFMYDGGGFVIGEKGMDFGLTNNLRANLGLAFDSSSRVILSTSHDTFILGPRTSLADPSGRPEFTFTDEPGDEVSFAARESLLGWPTPFEFSILGGRSPWWKRYVYYRLVWKKSSGARLEMLWRYERDFYAGKGWTEPMMMFGETETGLLAVDVRGS